MLTIGAEVGAAAFIAIGLCTRPAAFVLGFTMVVAAFGVHGAAPWFMAQGVPVSKEPALLYLIPMIAIILTGGGLFSLDAAIYKEGKRRRW
jgi:putative oxidoreductase